MPKSRLTETLIGVIALAGFIQVFDCNVKRNSYNTLKNSWLLTAGLFWGIARKATVGQVSAVLRC